MKKVILLLVLLSGFNAAFGCESPFDDVKGMTCEIECILCADRNIDIKLCDEVKERYKQYEEDFTIASEKCGKAQRAAKELEIKAKALEKKLNVNDEQYKANVFELSQLIVEAQKLRMIASDAGRTANNVLTNFLGEESIMMLQSKEFQSEVAEVLENIGE